MNITNCNEMYHYVKRLMAATLGIGSLLMGAAWAQEPLPHRQIILPARFDAALYLPLTQALQQSSLWKLPLAPDMRQIVRLQDFSLQAYRPQYASMTAISPQDMRLSMALTHEVWQGDQLLWTETRRRQQQWQYPGPRALGVGQSPTLYLSHLPRGAFSPLQPLPLASPFNTALFTHLSHDLTQDYLRWKQQQEQTL